MNRSLCALGDVIEAGLSMARTAGIGRQALKFGNELHAAEQSHVLEAICRKGAVKGPAAAAVHVPPGPQTQEAREKVVVRHFLFFFFALPSGPHKYYLRQWLLVGSSSSRRRSSSSSSSSSSREW